VIWPGIENAAIGSRAMKPIRRSLLFVPGDRPDRIAKAMAARADGVIVDLEDAVAPGMKKEARKTAITALANMSEPRPEVFIRINSVRSRPGLLDLLSLTEPQAARLWDGLLLPKTGSAGDISLVTDILDSCACEGVLGALIETIEGVENAMEIAGASPRLAFLMFGGADLSADLGVEMAWGPLAFARARVIAAAARYGLDSVDMPWLALDNDDGYRKDLKRSFALGFSARAAIHPRQIAEIHRALVPDAAAVTRAHRIVKAYEAAQGGVCVLDGKLVERPIVLGCQRVLALARMADNTR
jgi:(S)-citramalyl-CoA lyase